MIFLPNTTSNGTHARYLIVQHTPNVFRREPRNVGVVVDKSGYAAARFFGERDPGEWETSRLRSAFGNPDAYRLWVDHWRKLIANRDPIDKLLSSHGDEFSIIPGGELDDVGADTPHELCNYLYARLVSSGGLTEALTNTPEDEQATVLKNEITAAFRTAGIMFGSLLVRHPIYADWDVMGTRSSHRLAYYQESQGKAWAMEPVDFAVQRKRFARDHAAYARYVFSDLLERSRSSGIDIKTTAIVRRGLADEAERDVTEGLEILDGACKIVDWTKPQERSDFLQEREAIANEP